MYALKYYVFLYHSRGVVTRYVKQNLLESIASIFTWERMQLRSKWALRKDCEFCKCVLLIKYFGILYDIFQPNFLRNLTFGDHFFDIVKSWNIFRTVVFSVKVIKLFLRLKKFYENQKKNGSVSLCNGYI